MTGPDSRAIPDGGTRACDAVAYGERTLAFCVVRSARTTLSIHVHPSGEIEVRAPLGTPSAEVRARVHRRARWIVQHQRRFAEIVQPRPPLEYANGETHRYLGRQYRLKLVPPDARGDGVRLVGRYLEVRTSQPADRLLTETLLNRWYRDKASVRLHERFEWGCTVMERHGVARPPLAIRAMSQRWGSCTAAGQVILNPRLVLAPTACIDYVVVHELCHLRHSYHNRAFYSLLGRAMPDWTDRKARLEAVQ